jgi:hypothetical protein
VERAPQFRLPAHGAQGTESLSENGKGFCLGGKGSIGKARGGSRPAAVCDRQAPPPAGLSGLDCVGSGGTDRRRSAPPLTALPNPEFPSRRTPPHFQTGS